MAIKTKAKKHIGFWPKKATISLILIVLVVVLFLIGFKYNRAIFGPNVDTGGVESVDLYIPSNADFEDVLNLLTFSGVITDIGSFKWVAEKKGYNRNPKGGRYILKSGMSNNQLVNILRAGRQSPVKVTFTNIRTHEELSGQLAKRLEPDSTEFLTALKDKDLLQKYGFEPSTILAMILPNTYEFYWNTSPSGFLYRMFHEYNSFWNEEKTLKAELMGLSKLEVSILASIVDEETIKADEKPVVAGLYINRLNLGMRLQADPTIKFVIGDFKITRVLARDLKIDSPYNTYIYSGLPPGPIRMPSISGIEAILNHEKHNYLYMCAKDDFSGYHNFARTYEQHNHNAAKYRKALSRLRIYR